MLDAKPSPLKMPKPWSHISTCSLCRCCIQVLLLVGYFAVLSPANRAMLSWGKPPSLLQRLCAVPAPYFQDACLRQVGVQTLNPVYWI